MGKEEGLLQAQAHGVCPWAQLHPDQAGDFSRRAGPAIQISKAQGVQLVHLIIVGTDPDGRVSQEAMQPRLGKGADDLVRLNERG